MSTLTVERPVAEPATAPARPPGRRFRMPHGLTSSRFAIAVGAALVAGLVALLAVNTALAAGAIRLRALEIDLARAEEQRQQLQVRVEGLSSPASLQAAAVAAGMVPAGAPAFLDPATGQLSGELVPAAPPATPLVQTEQVRRPEPQPTAVVQPDPGQAPSDGQTASDGQAVAALPERTPDTGLDGAVIVLPGERRGPAAPLPSGAAAPLGQAGDQATISDSGTGGDRASLQPGGDSAVVRGEEID